MIVRVTPHKQFERDGDNLLIAIPIVFTQAALGAQIEIPTLEGTTNLELPAGTQHGALFRVHEEGLPNLRSKNRGDLVIVTQLVVPQKLNEAQKKLLSEYAQTESLDVGSGGPSLWNKIKDAVKGS